MKILGKLTTPIYNKVGWVGVVLSNVSIENKVDIKCFL